MKLLLLQRGAAAAKCESEVHRPHVEDAEAEALLTFCRPLQSTRLHAAASTIPTTAATAVRRSCAIARSMNCAVRVLRSSTAWLDRRSSAAEAPLVCMPDSTAHLRHVTTLRRTGRTTALPFKLLQGLVAAALVTVTWLLACAVMAPQSILMHDSDGIGF